MGVVLDGIALFGEGESQIEVGSSTREHIERAAAGLDGVVSIDQGGRGREIRQKGVLRARSKTEMDKRTEAITAFQDGDTHTLVVGGRLFENLRIDEFEVKAERTSGAGVEADYEIVYRQLV